MLIDCASQIEVPSRLSRLAVRISLHSALCYVLFQGLSRPTITKQHLSRCPLSSTTSGSTLEALSSPRWKDPNQLQQEQSSSVKQPGASRVRKSNLTPKNLSSEHRSAFGSYAIELNIQNPGQSQLGFPLNFYLVVSFLE